CQCRWNGPAPRPKLQKCTYVHSTFLLQQIAEISNGIDWNARPDICRIPQNSKNWRCNTATTLRTMRPNR
ncbi:MAG: hypothetical protein ABIH03_12195, partial [Pseudomonadota bacterium]